jgi:hypothetical protein
MPDKPAPKRKAHRGPGQRLSLTDRFHLLELHKAHPQWSISELADHAGVNPKTAHFVVTAASKSAAELMAAYAGPALMQWLKAMKVAATRGDHRPTKDWLMHAGSIDPLPETQRGSGPSIVIVNASLPGLPAAPAITIDAITTALPSAPGTLPDKVDPD